MNTTKNSLELPSLTRFLLIVTFLIMPDLVIAKENNMNRMPKDLKRFIISEPAPKCERWRANMPERRNVEAYKIYIEARKVWRSKIQWQLTHAETKRILHDVQKAADMGDWGARALMAHFYLHGLGVLPTNRVLSSEPEKAVRIVQMAAAEGQPWGFYDLGVAYEQGYGGLPVNHEIAWAYYLRGAQLGSPEAQMTLASEYGNAGRQDEEKKMILCAYDQENPAAALKLAIRERGLKNYGRAIRLYQDAVMFGSKDAAASLVLLFGDGYWPNQPPQDVVALKILGVVQDVERENRYLAIYHGLEVNPDLKFHLLDKVLPLPPKVIPGWSGIADAIEKKLDETPTY
jgi:hypothetical protein